MNYKLLFIMDFYIPIYIYLRVLPKNKEVFSMSLKLIKKECPLCHHEYMMQDDSNDTHTCLNCGTQIKNTDGLKDIILSFLNFKLKDIIFNKTKSRFPTESNNTLALILTMINSMYMGYICCGSLNFITEEFLDNMVATLKNSIPGTFQSAAVNKRIQEIGYGEIVQFFENEIVSDSELDSVMNSDNVKYVINRYLELRNQ